MSSAALQAAPHQPTSVGSHSPIAATSSKAYSATSSQSRDGYYNQSAANASPSSSRRANRRPSANGASSTNNNPPAQFYAPTGSTPASSAATARGTSSTQPPPDMTTTGAPVGYPVMAPGDHQRGVPPVVSPRTSSNRPTAPTDRSRRQYATDVTSSPRQTSGDGSQDRVERQRSNGNTQSNGAERVEDPAVSAARTRRRAQQNQEASTQRPAGAREPRTSQSASAVQRSQPSSGTPSDLSREASEVLSRLVVSKPEVDLEREKERMAEAVPSSPTVEAAMGQLSIVPGEGVDDTGRGGSRSRHDHSSSSKKEGSRNSKFGDYFLGNTLGEGEFGKVKMGWKQSGVEVAIKLIRRDTVGTNPSRLNKIYREISILRQITHPNIVRLHEMVETEKQIGIILEYASGGELFDYILNHRYLKDGAARRLFAQLVSGVGYLHKKGIVHRDLKLENLLLDRNRNIIITDFGFANTFNPEDELGEEIEYGLATRDFVKRMELDKIQPDGHRRGDLMQTSCGSPCYAAPELVVSDSLYTGRKVDVWSCGVILYAMLAGYLPFDDDPANPEGDNINLLYKYIVSTPLTFPEYVTPHARDLLRRILVPDPRKRADLFEVARHSWLSEYSHVVGFITSSNTTSKDIGTTTVGSEEEPAVSHLGRSASVREPSKATKPAKEVGDLARKHGGVNPESDTHPKVAKDTKRHTIQPEYVGPTSHTQRGEASSAPSTAQPSGSRTRARAGSQGPVEVPAAKISRRTVSTEKPLPQDPPVQKSSGSYPPQARRPTSVRNDGMPPPSRPGREPPRSASEAAYLSAHAPPVSIARPTTGGSMGSTASRSGSLALASRGSYSTPAAPTVAGTNAQGRMTQPKVTHGGYNVSAPLDSTSSFGQQSVQTATKPARHSGLPQVGNPEDKGHKRSNTIGGFFSRINSFSGKRHNNHSDPAAEKPKKSYPPVSMSASLAQGQTQDTPRQSMDSRRSISFGFGKKRSNSNSLAGSQTTLQEKPRRFSLLPQALSLKSIGIGKDSPTAAAPSEHHYDERSDSPGYLGQVQQARNPDGRSSAQQFANDGSYDRNRESPVQKARRGTASTASPVQHQQRYVPHQVTDPRSGVPPQFLPPLNFRSDSAVNTESDTSLNDPRNNRNYQAGYNEYDDNASAGRKPAKGNRGVLQKNNRKFTEAYEQDQGNGYGPTHNDHAGSTGAARKVMDFFRRRGRDRGQ